MERKAGRLEQSGPAGVFPPERNEDDGGTMSSHDKGAAEPDAETLSPVLPDDLVRTAIALLDTANRAGLRIATAESCTGGLLASLLTDIEGISNVFDRGFIAYSKDAKCDLLGVSRAMIKNCGAVSEPVARAMAEGALARSNAAAAVAITGFAGRGHKDDEPGLVHFACAGQADATRHCVRHFGDIGRGATRIACLRVALDMLAATIATLAGPENRPLSEAES